MERLNDYSGQFLPDLKASDFSPDKLIDLIALYSKLYLALDGFWYLTVKERVGNNEALACNSRTWEKFCRYEMAKITELLNISGSDVITFLKGMQILPWFQNVKYKIEIRNQHSAVLTITYCPTLESLEKEGTGREREICKLSEPLLFKHYASFFNPDIKVKCLKSPPRKRKAEICCQWEFTCDK